MFCPSSILLAMFISEIVTCPGRTFFLSRCAQVFHGYRKIPSSRRCPISILVVALRVRNVANRARGKNTSRRRARARTRARKVNDRKAGMPNGRYFFNFYITKIKTYLACPNELARFRAAAQPRISSSALQIRRPERKCNYK